LFSKIAPSASPEFVFCLKWLEILRSFSNLKITKSKKEMNGQRVRLNFVLFLGRRKEYNKETTKESNWMHKGCCSSTC
jgi:hypothetical protein